MGSYLAVPCREVDEELGAGNGMEYGVGEMQGWRRHMEDAHISKADLAADITGHGARADPRQHTFALFAVFDGHGGKEVAKFCRDHFTAEFVKSPQFNSGNYVGALRETFHTMDAMVDDESHAGKLQEYRNIPNPSDRASEQSQRTAATNVSSLVDAPVPPAGEPNRKIEYSRAMELFKQLLQQENEAKKVAIGLQGDDVKAPRDDAALKAASEGPFEDSEKESIDETPPPPAAMEDSQMDVVDDDGEIELDLEVHGRMMPQDVLNASESWKFCKLADHRVNAGCTAVVAFRIDDKLMVANAGDSRAVLSRMGVAIHLSLDHKPGQVREYERISNAGGFVNAAGRVNGNLNLSRAIGDLKYKKVPGVHRKHQIITADPDITVTKLEPGQDEFLILACDGIWDCFSSQQAVDFVRQRLIQGMPIAQIIKEAFDYCLADDPRSSAGVGADNMTFMIVKLKDVIV